GGARPAAALVQVGAGGVGGGRGAARGAARVRRRAAGGDGNPRVGFDRRVALPGDPAAAGRHRRLERGRARRAGDARQHDRHRRGRPAGARAMNGAADMGGMHGFGPVEPEPNEPVFHAAWEKSAFALNMAIGVAGIWTLDAFRFARESLPPPQYLNTSYYGLWVVTLENMMLKHGVATREEIDGGHALAPIEKARQPVTAAMVANMVRCGS